MHIGMLPTRHARYRPHHEAVIFEGQRLTYAQFNRRINRLAHALLGLGLDKGDKLAIILPNCLEVLDLYWAAAKIGAVVVPLSPALRPAGLTTLITDADARLVVTCASLAPTVEAVRPDLPGVAHYLLTDATQPGYLNYAALTTPASPAEPPDPGLTGQDVYNIIYSSGTTGLPKGIVQTHYVRAMYGLVFGAAFRFRPESIVLHTGSLVFNGAFVTLLPAMHLGAAYILHRKFDAETFIDTVAREGVTHTILVPAQIIAILNSPRFSPAALQSLEMLCSVGAPLHQRHKDSLTAHLPGRFYELYGITEGITTILDNTDYARKPGSVGSPPPFFEVRVVDDAGQDVPPGTVGEIIGRSPFMMQGYHHRPDQTRLTIRAGWAYSGDLGYLDEDGFVYLVDRKKDMILSGGVNVYPKDIEEVIVRHPAVQEVAVFGIPSETWGETPLAAVILRPGQTVSPGALQAWINERVEAKYQRVSQVVLMDDFPRSTAGKTLKRVLRQPYWEEG